MNVNRLAILTIIITLFAAWIYAKNKSLIAENSVLNNQNIVLNESLTSLNDGIKKTNFELENNRIELQKIQDRSRVHQRELKNAIKNTECANVRIPDDVIKLLRERAEQIHKAADTQKSNRAFFNKPNSN